MPHSALFRYKRIRVQGDVLWPLLIVMLLMAGCVSPGGMTSLKIEEVSVEAPFAMPVITIPDFRDCPRFVITDWRAVEGDRDKTSQAIAQAIDAAHQHAGGVVVIPVGEWLTGKIHLKSHVCLHLEEGAVLSFSGNPEDYLPPVHTTWEGMECYNYSPLIYAYECENVAITGSGQLKAEMDVWKIWFSRPPAHMEALKRLYHLAVQNRPVQERQMVGDEAHLRPHFIQFNRCQHVLLEGISIFNSPFWVIHPYLCKDVVIRKVKVWAHGHNNDGVDPEMSQNMLIEDCIFDQGDDAIAVKSGRNQDAWRLATPTRNLVIRNCRVKNGHQLLAIGSELSGGVENVFMDHCAVEEGAKLNHLVYIKTNERRGGFVQNIHVSNVKSGKIDKGILGIETDVLYQWRDLVPTYERRLTPIQDIYLTDIEAADIKFISRIQGQEELPVENVRLTNVTGASIQEAEYLNRNVIDFQHQD